MPFGLKKNLTFLARVRDGLTQMRPAERRVAEFILDFTGDIAGYTATEVAKLTNVSNATISRFVQKLGYSSYDELRRSVRSERGTGAALFMVGTPSHPPEDALAAHVEQGTSNIARTFVGITLADIDAVANSMIKSRRVWVMGFRTSHSFATYLHWQTFQVLDTISVLPRVGQTLAEHISGIAKEDCVIIFGLRRSVGFLNKAIEQIARTGASILFITDAGVKPCKGVKWHFRCQTEAPGPLFNHVAVLSLCHLLATRVIELAGTPGRRRLSAIELIHDSLGEL